MQYIDLILNKTYRIAIFEHIPAVTEASRDHYQSTIASSKALGIEFEVCIYTQKIMRK